MCIFPTKLCKDSTLLCTCTAVYTSHYTCSDIKEFPVPDKSEDVTVKEKCKQHDSKDSVKIVRKNPKESLLRQLELVHLTCFCIT